jgi:hypothetical protein
MRLRLLTSVAMLVLTFGVVESRAAAVPDLGAFGTATIDGQLSAGEWDGASSYDFTVTTLDGTTPATLFVMNDYQSVYLAVRVAASSLPYSSVSFEFDNHDVGALFLAGDDAIVLNSALGLFDDVRLENGNAPTDVEVGGTNDGAVAVTNDGQYSYYELSHPLNSGDPNDLAVAPGDTIGYLMNLVICGASCADTYLPPQEIGWHPARIHLYPWQPPVVDTTPPQLSVVASLTTLWPPNHHLVPVDVTITASDDSGVAPAVSLVEITSSEPDNGLGDGDTANDIQSPSATHLLLRAERRGGGAGRAYTATYRAVDGAGNVTFASVQIVVPTALGAPDHFGPAHRTARAPRGQ